MQRDKIISIITIGCFVSVVFIPIGIVLAWFFTDWSKKRKIIISAISGVVYVVIVTLLLVLEPVNNGDGGVVLPFGSGQGTVAIENGQKRKSKGSEILETENQLDEKNEEYDELKEEIKKKPKKVETRRLGRAGFSVLFFLLMLFLIIWQNLKAKKKRQVENPYVDTELYRLPLHSGSKMPMVHFLRLRLRENEVIYYATETNKKDDEGDLVVTNERIVIYSATENVEIPLSELEGVTSITNTVIQIFTKDKKYYVFMDESQLKYALAVIRWAFKQQA